MHRLLKRQIKQNFGKNFDINEFDPKMLQLLENVTETYTNFDEEKRFLNHTVKENKKELKEAYDNMLTSSRLAGIGEMMENITHQWKQPLNIILHIVALLKVDFKDNKDLDIIEEQTQYLDDTITDFTNFSSHTDSEKECFELEKSIRETIKIFAFQARKNHIQVNQKIEKNIFIEGHIGKLNQALLVIFSNAKDAFLSKNPLSKIITITTVKKEHSVVISIQDNAGGIPVDIIDKIFEPYFTTKFKHKGTGIGLSMTYNIIQKMHGNIEAKNHEDGAIFIITLPTVNKTTQTKKTI
ncbi:HAMP domain-containing histidine kinase [bacterium]|nr:HAMP domain-containing histidine kinase [bacterium]MBU1959366.1 HAMP domain-containing histidine kinase [bacterium]